MARLMDMTGITWNHSGKDGVQVQFSVQDVVDKLPLLVFVSPLQRSVNLPSLKLA